MSHSFRIKERLKQRINNIIKKDISLIGFIIDALYEVISGDWGKPEGIN